MIFDGNEFLTLANQLYQNPPSKWPRFKKEVILRTCISRAYYGVFLQVRAFLINEQNKVFVSMDVLKRGDGEHANVRDLIKTVAQRVKDYDLGIDLYDDLFNLRELRNKADYTESEIDFEILEDNAGLALELADSILSNLAILREKCKNS